MEDLELIKGCCKNDRICQKMFYEHFYDTVFGICLRYAKSKEEAKTMLNYCFAKILETITKFDPKDNLLEWVKNLTIINAIDYLRKNKHEYLIVHTVYGNENEQDIKLDVSDDDIVNTLKSEQVFNAIQKLSPAYRTIYNLSVIDGYSYKEIAEMLDVSEETSRSNIEKAKYNLRKNLQQLVKTKHE